MTKIILSIILIFTLLCVPCVSAEEEEVNLLDIDGVSYRTSNEGMYHTYNYQSFDNLLSTKAYTFNSQGAWIQADLPTAMQITRVVITAGSAKPTEGSANITIELSNDPDFMSDKICINENDKLPNGIAVSNGTKEFAVSVTDKYRYIRISNPLIVSLAEVDVYGYYTEPEIVPPADIEETELTRNGITTYFANKNAGEGSYGAVGDGVHSNYLVIYTTKASDGSGNYLHSWFAFDFGIPCQLSSITLYTPTLGYTMGGNNLVIEASNDPEFSDVVMLRINDKSFTSSNTYNIYDTDCYRYVRFKPINPRDALILGDIRINGYFVPPALELEKITDGIDEIIDTVPRGLDMIELDFTTQIDASSVNQQSVSLKLDDETIPYEIENSQASPIDGKLKLKFKKSLENDKELKLTLNEVGDIFSQTVSGEYTFAVGGEDSGSETAVVDKPMKEADSVKVRGTLKSSHGLGIEGRKAYLYIEAPDGSKSDTPVAETVSGKDGAFEFTHAFDEDNDASGMYIFYVSGDYTLEYGSNTYTFMNKELEDSILLAVKNTKTTEDIKLVFSEENYVSLGIKPVETRNVISDYDSFYAHFVEKEYASAEKIAIAYENYIILEMLNQAEDVNDITDILSKDINCQTLGISYERLSKVLENQDAMYSDILDLDPCAELEAFGTECTKIVEKYLAMECGKAEPELVDNTQTIYDGQGAVIELAFLDEQTDVSEIEFRLTSTDTSAFNDTEVSLDIDGTYTKTVNDGTLTIEVSPKRSMPKAQRIGTLTLTVDSGSEDYSITMAGNVTYKTTLNDEDITVTTNLIPKTSAVSFTQQSSGGTGNKNDGSTSRPSGSFGGGGGGITVTPVVPVPDTKTYFGDLASSEWAREAIEVLTDKGIVSQSADSNFYPERNITREEFTKLMVMAMNLYDASAAYPFTDGDASAWYAPYIASAYKAGIVTGMADGSFGVGENITREDMATIIYRATKLTSAGDAAAFADDELISDYAREAVYALRAKGIVNGVSDTEFAPRNNATRAMAAKMIYEMLKEVA